MTEPWMIEAAKLILAYEDSHGSDGFCARQILDIFPQDVKTIARFLNNNGLSLTDNEN